MSYNYHEDPENLLAIDNTKIDEAWVSKTYKYAQWFSSDFFFTTYNDMDYL